MRLRFLLPLALLLGAPLRAQQLPPLPSSVPTALGPVAIERVPGLKCQGEEAFGCFDSGRFVIQVRDSIALVVAWQTVRHERFHVLLFVAGIHLSGPEGVEDLLADATATQDILEMRDSLDRGHQPVVPLPLKRETTEPTLSLPHPIPPEAL